MEQHRFGENSLPHRRPQAPEWRLHSVNLIVFVAAAPRGLIGLADRLRRRR